MKKLKIISCIVISIAFLLIMLNYHFRYIVLDLYGPPEKENVVKKNLQWFNVCQKTYYSINKEFTNNLELLECGFSEDVIFYLSENDFKNSHPNVCIRVPIIIKPDSFTVVAESNIDGENMILYANDSGWIDSPLCK